MLTKKLTTAIVTFSTIVTLSAAPLFPAFADSQAGQIGNGAFSNNQVSLSTSNTNSAVQNNSADITNNVTNKSDTGNNHVDFTTGGNATVETGAATSNTQIGNFANSNQLSVTPGCNCANGGTQALQDSNGAFSNNQITASSANSNEMFQNNSANVDNNVKSTAETGGNTANDTTNGNAHIISGDSVNNVGILNALNQNTATSGVNSGDNGGVFGTSAVQTGNGAFANDNINVAKTNSNVADQTNTAYIMNDVKSKASSGDNAGDFTTGGGTFIGTGASTNNTWVKNLANSNILAGFDNGTGCGCDMTFVKQGVNGAESTNGVTASVSNSNSAFQTNDTSTFNEVSTTQKSGANSASYSTSLPFGFSDPAVIAGPATSNTQVETAVNQNEAGNGVQVGGWNLNFTWNPFSL